MNEIIQTLKDNIRKVKYGSVSVKLKIHDGRIVQTVYETSKTEIGKKKEANDDIA